jgi:hypothetical protein
MCSAKRHVRFTPKATSNATSAAQIAELLGRIDVDDKSILALWPFLPFEE